MISAMEEHVVTDKFIVIGDRLLIKPLRPDMQTPSGLYLPPTVQENQKNAKWLCHQDGTGLSFPDSGGDRRTMERAERTRPLHSAPSAGWRFSNLPPTGCNRN